MPYALFSSNPFVLFLGHPKKVQLAVLNIQSHIDTDKNFVTRKTILLFGSRAMGLDYCIDSYLSLSEFVHFIIN